MGNVSTGTAGELLSILENLVMASLKFSSPGFPVCFTFKTQTRVNLAKKAGLPTVI